MKINKFKVTDECISCMACIGLAEDIFQLNDNGKAFVVKQPENERELELARQAVDACPVDAIVEICQNVSKQRRKRWTQAKRLRGPKVRSVM